MKKFLALSFLYFVFDIYYLDLSEERLNATRPEEELNGVVVSAIVVGGGGNTVGPLLGPTHCLLASLHIGKAVPHSFFLSFSLKLTEIKKSYYAFGWNRRNR